MNHPDFMTKMLSGNKKIYIFSRFQLYARAYGRRTTLRPWLPETKLNSPKNVKKERKI